MKLWTFILEKAFTIQSARIPATAIASKLLEKLVYESGIKSGIIAFGSDAASRRVRLDNVVSKLFQVSHILDSMTDPNPSLILTENDI